MPPCPYDQALLVIVSAADEANNCGTRVIAPTERVISDE